MDLILVVEDLSHHKRHRCFVEISRFLERSAKTMKIKYLENKELYGSNFVTFCLMHAYLQPLLYVWIRVPAHVTVHLQMTHQLQMPQTLTPDHLVC